jgi:SRSO17 transposase
MMQEIGTESNSFSLIDTTPMDCSLHAILPLRVEMVSGSDKETLWNALMNQFHYLGYRKMVGCSIKYLVYHERRPIAAFGWRAAALKLDARDSYIGWSAEQRRLYLSRIANNNRFLILPWVRIPYLASHLLSIMTRRVKDDWYAIHGQKLFLFETFVDRERFSGTCYRAANWIVVGRTKGFTKKGKGFAWHGKPKEILLYVVDRDFRKNMGFIKRNASSPWSLRLLQREEKLVMMTRQAGWNPAVMPSMDLTTEDLDAIANDLIAFHEEICRYYGRREQHQLGLAYLRGLLSDLERKTAEGIALLLLTPAQVRRLQDFITQHKWDNENMLAFHQRQLSDAICGNDGNGMINVDSCEVVKKGTHSVGVHRQYCGNVGKLENCQSGVFIGYANERGYGLVDCRLYLPEAWFGDEYKVRREQCGIPEHIQFRTKIEIAMELIKKTATQGTFAARWLGCDCTFGSSWEFLETVGQSYWYFANVRSTTPVWIEPPKMRMRRYKGRGRRSMKPRLVSEKPTTVAQLAAKRNIVWQTTKLAEGAKGPVVTEVACMRVIPSKDNTPMQECWLFIRKYPDGELKYALSNAPKDIPFEELVRASTLRWPIEQCFQEGKEELGMDHYEHRSWIGWHRHMLFVFMAQLFVWRMRDRYKKKLLA